MRLKGKVALVTGFGSGLGQAIARLYVREGGAVMGTSTTEAKGKETLEMIRKEGGNALFQAGDVRRMEQMKAVVAEAVKNFGDREPLNLSPRGNDGRSPLATIAAQWLKDPNTHDIIGRHDLF